MGNNGFFYRKSDHVQDISLNHRSMHFILHVAIHDKKSGWRFQDDHYS